MRIYGLNKYQNGLRRLWGAPKFEKTYLALAEKCKNKGLSKKLLDAVVISQLMTAKGRARKINQALDADPAERRRAINFIDGLRNS